MSQELWLVHRTTPLGYDVIDVATNTRVKAMSAVSAALPTLDAALTQAMRAINASSYRIVSLSPITDGLALLIETGAPSLR